MSKNRSGFLFLLIIFILLGIIIFTYKEKFMVLLNTGFSASKDFIENNLGKDKNDEMVTEKVDLLKNGENSIREKIESNISDLKEKMLKEEKIITEKLDSQNRDNINKDTVETKTNEDPKDQQKNVKTLKKQIYFSVVQEDEKLKIVSVQRNITYVNTPLTETITALLKGPSSYEKTTDVITNIPSKTKLLSVSIKNSTAYINFSKDFELNPYGKESTIAQIKQVVYTATEFSNIKSVQFLIDGKVKTYLGGEGVIINKPITRSDFS